MLDVLINLLCIFLGVYSGAFVHGSKLNWNTDLSANVGCMVWFGLATILMKVFRVSWILVPAAKGISPDHYAIFAFITLAFGLLSIRSYLRMKKARQKESG